MLSSEVRIQVIKAYYNTTNPTQHLLVTGPQHIVFKNTLHSESFDKQALNICSFLKAYKLTGLTHIHSYFIVAIYLSVLFLHSIYWLVTLYLSLATPPEHAHQWICLMNFFFAESVLSVTQLVCSVFVS